MHLVPSIRVLRGRQAHEGSRLEFDLDLPRCRILGLDGEDVAIDGSNARGSRPDLDRFEREEDQSKKRHKEYGALRWPGNGRESEGQSSNDLPDRNYSCSSEFE